MIAFRVLLIVLGIMVQDSRMSDEDGLNTKWAAIRTGFMDPSGYIPYIEWREMASPVIP